MSTVNETFLSDLNQRTQRECCSSEDRRREPRLRTGVYTTFLPAQPSSPVSRLSGPTRRPVPTRQTMDRFATLQRRSPGRRRMPHATHGGRTQVLNELPCLEYSRSFFLLQIMRRERAIFEINKAARICSPAVCNLPRLLVPASFQASSLVSGSRRFFIRRATLDQARIQDKGGRRAQSLPCGKRQAALSVVSRKYVHKVVRSFGGLSRP